MINKLNYPPLSQTQVFTMWNKSLGAIFLIIGTSIGAGILSLPLISGLSGLWITLPLLILAWVLMTYTGLLVLEVTLSLQAHHNSFSSMAYETLGLPGKITAWITCLLLLYALISAYISGDSSLLTLLIKQQFHLTLPTSVTACLFILIFGGMVWWSTRCVDLFNRFFLSIKGGALIICIALLMPSIQWPLLNQYEVNHHFFGILPLFLTAFGYHHIIPTLTNYVGHHPRTLKKIIIAGTSIPFIIYLAWLIVTLGTIPLTGTYSFDTLTQHHSDLSFFLISIDHLQNNPWLHQSLSLFANIAVTTSFLGVSIGLFDFLADSCQRDNTRRGRTQTALLTFTPPLLFAIFYPRGFLMALSLAALFVIILEVILPSLMAHQLRKKQSHPSEHKKQWLLGFTTVVGIGLIGIECLTFFYSY